MFLFRYQRKENRLILSITDRFDQIQKGDPSRLVKHVLLPSGSPSHESSTLGYTSSRRSSLAPVIAAAAAHSAQQATAPSAPESGQRSFSTRRKTVGTLQDISARYSALTPSAITDAGVPALKKAKKHK
jgi:hypothetical protein